MLCEQSYVLTMLGRWDEALARASELPDDRIGSDTGLASLLTGVLEIHVARGDLRLAQGRLHEALAAAERAIEGRSTLGLGSQDVKQGYRHGLEAAFQLGDSAALERMLRIVEDAPPGLRPPYLAALAQRFRARMAGDDPAADRLYDAAVAQFASLELPYVVAVTSLEHADWLTGA